MARVRPLGILLAFLVLGTGLATIAWVGIRAGRLPVTDETAALSGALSPLAVATGISLGLFVLFRVGGRRALHRHSSRDLQSLSAIETVAVILVLVFLVAVTFGSFTGTLFSLGLVGFGLTLALQRPILAVGGWCAIVFARLFRVGDRIEVNKLQGDVLEIALFTTRLWELDATTARPTGRILTVTNALFLEQPVSNATVDGPYVFDEFAAKIAYGSDMPQAESLLRRVGAQVIDATLHAQMAERYERDTQAFPIENAFPRAPLVLVGLTPEGIELRLRYLVEIRNRSRTRTALCEAWLEALGERAAEAVPKVGGTDPAPAPT